MQITAAHLDAFGRLTGLRLHDSELIELAFVAGRSLTLKLRRVDGTIATLQALDPARVGIIEFQANPIVANAYAWLPTSSTEPHLSTCIRAWRTLFGQTVDGPHLEEAITALRSKHPRAILFHCECSYGGEIAVLCESLEGE